MTEKLVLTVFGATGGQGGSVINTVLTHPVLAERFHIRGITRSIESDTSQRLTSQGVEMILANMDDKTSLEQALRGSHTVFAMTNFFDHLDGGRETQQGKNIADVCLSVGVEHLIWSSTGDVLAIAQGHIRGAAHIESKYNVQKYIESIRANKLVATYVVPGVFMANFHTLIREVDESHAVMRVAYGAGDKEQIPWIDSEVDTGTYVGAVLLQYMKSPDDVNGTTLQAVSEWLTPNQTVSVLSEATGKTIHYQELSLEDCKQSFPESLRTEIGATIQLIRDFSYFGKGSAEKQDQIDTILEDTGLSKVTVKDWAERHGPLKFAKIPSSG